MEWLTQNALKSIHIQNTLCLVAYWLWQIHNCRPANIIKIDFSQWKKRDFHLTSQQNFIAVVRQPYDIRVEGNEVFLGNVAFLRCFIPEHVRTFVVVSSWFRGDEELHTEMADMSKFEKPLIFAFFPFKYYLI